MNDTDQPAPPDRVECPAAKDPAVRLFILAAMLIGFGVWCFHDAYLGGKYPYPEDAKLNELMNYYFNHIGGIALPLAGLVPLIWGIVFLRRRLVATADGIGYAGRPPIPWQNVTRLDATDLPRKEILRLHYGGAKPLVLDGWKLTRFKDLVAFVEAHVPPDAIETPDEEGDKPQQKEGHGEP